MTCSVDFCVFPTKITPLFFFSISNLNNLIFWSLYNLEVVDFFVGFQWKFPVGFIDVRCPMFPRRGGSSKVGQVGRRCNLMVLEDHVSYIKFIGCGWQSTLQKYQGLNVGNVFGGFWGWWNTTTHPDVTRWGCNIAMCLTFCLSWKKHTVKITLFSMWSSSLTPKFWGIDLPFIGTFTRSTCDNKLWLCKMQRRTALDIAACWPKDNVGQPKLQEPGLWCYLYIFIIIYIYCIYIFILLTMIFLIFIYVMLCKYIYICIPCA